MYVWVYAASKLYSKFEISMSSVACEVTLTENDIPGAKLSKPYNKHTILHYGGGRGVEAPISWKKQQILDRFVMQLLMNSLFTFSFYFS